MSLRRVRQDVQVSSYSQEGLSSFFRGWERGSVFSISATQLLRSGKQGVGHLAKWGRGFQEGDEVQVLGHQSVSVFIGSNRKIQTVFC